MTPELAARLAVYRIELLSEATDYCVLARDNCFVLAAAGRNGALEVGSSGMMTENGLAYLVWREGQPRLVAKGRDLPAGAAEVETLRGFSADLQAVLGEET